MKALIYSAYYEPEVAASLYLSTNLYEDIASNGVDVTLFVPVPTRGVSDEKRKEYIREKKEEKKCDGHLIIKRVLLPREGKQILGRVIRYLMMNAAFIVKGIGTKADFIFVQSTPPTQGAMAAVIKKIKRIPLIYNLQDVFPDSLVGTGITKENSIVYKVGRIIEKFTYKNCDKIIVISEDMKINIIKKGVPESKIAVINNWIDGNLVSPVSKDDNYLFDKYSISSQKFNVVYAGNLGYAQNIEVILQCAEILKDNKDIQFVIFGKGAQEEEYKTLADKMNLSNLIFLPLQPYSEVRYVYSLGDVSIVSCKKGFGGSAMPSKIWSIMATGTPVLASFDSNTELHKMINDQKVGLFSESENAIGLSNNILQLYHDIGLRKRMGESARKYIEEFSSRESATAKYIEQIMGCVDGRG